MSIPHTELQEVLGRCDRRTLFGNLKPLVDVGLLIDDGDRVTLVWPPVITRFLCWQDDAWVSVPPGAIPLARSGTHLRIEVTAQLPMMLRVYVVTHRREDSELQQVVAGKRITRDQTKAIELRLDEQPGFEQILVHLSWPVKRGVVEVDPEEGTLDTLRPHLLQRERRKVLERAGPGWVEEWLVHHL